jgi:hypothetical protein
MLWMRIKVADITGKNAIASSHAQRLYTILRLELSTQWQPTTLDFAGVDVALCLFFHTAIGQLYEDLPVEYRFLRLLRHLHCEELLPFRA